MRRIRSKVHLTISDIVWWLSTADYYLRHRYDEYIQLSNKYQNGKYR